MDQLLPIAHLLEDLELQCSDIGVHKDVAYLGPSRSLQQFARLKSLSVPQGVFINATTRDISSPHPIDVLPPSLESLCVQDPTPAIIQWLSMVFDARDVFPSLKSIFLNFEHDPEQRGSDYEDTAVKADFHARRIEAGISFDITNHTWSCVNSLLLETR
jgi:hypothetical protein